MIIITYLSVYCKYLYYFNMDPMAIYFTSSEKCFQACLSKSWHGLSKGIQGASVVYGFRFISVQLWATDNNK